MADWEADKNNPIVTLKEDGTSFTYPDSKFDEDKYYKIGVYSWSGSVTGIWVKTWNGLSIYVSLWSEDLWLSVPFAYATRLKGLCGNYNQDSSDDRTLNDGTVLSITSPASHYNFAKV